MYHFVMKLSGSRHAAEVQKVAWWGTGDWLTFGNITNGRRLVRKSAPKEVLDGSGSWVMKGTTYSVYVFVGSTFFTPNFLHQMFYINCFKPFFYTFF